MNFTHPTGRPLTEEEERQVVAKLPHPGMIMQRTPEQWDALVQMTILRLFGERTLAELDAAEAHVDEITERLRKAELIKAEAQQEELDNECRI